MSTALLPLDSMRCRNCLRFLAALTRVMSVTFPGGGAPAMTTADSAEPAAAGPCTGSQQP